MHYAGDLRVYTMQIRISYECFLKSFSQVTTWVAHRIWAEIGIYLVTILFRFQIIVKPFLQNITTLSRN